MLQGSDKVNILNVNKNDIVMVYMPEILTSLREISKRFHVKEERVREWIDKGAPISAVSAASDSRRTYYSCEVMRLQMWLEQHND
ncbi:MAG: hypothetical protein IJU76_08390 [Desulfovibrionaceae bacterium]|nr:hypothetical protein [Desulfovibrionaceae bacterium]